jgi:protein-L-isoaspartate(D-aspartate) O-methyltransferase
MDNAVLREDMVDSLQHPSKGCLRSEAVGLAMRSVPREAFLDESPYLDRAAECYGTTVLAPSTVARLLDALDAQPGDNVLVVGAGAGYTVAVLAEIVGADHVQAVDISRRLVHVARDNLRRAGYGEVLVDCCDGADGLPQYAPYDRILVEAAAVEPPRRLLSQLAPGGRLVLPLGAQQQSLAAIENGTVCERFGPVVFRPLLVDGEQADTVERNRTLREDLEHAQRAQERRKGWEQDWIDWDHLF